MVDKTQYMLKNCNLWLHVIRYCPTVESGVVLIIATNATRLVIASSSAVSISRIALNVCGKST